MDHIDIYKEKLEKLHLMLKQLNSSHSRIRQLKRCVFVLKTMLKDDGAVPSPYGPQTPFVRFSRQ